MSRVLAIDYGLVRVGLAVTDPLQITANGLETISTERLIAFVTTYLKEEEVSHIVVGLPHHEDGTPSQLAPQIEKLARKLVQLFPKIKVVLQDESHTSREAEEIIKSSVTSRKKRRSKELVDKISAVLILQRYLGHI